MESNEASKIADLCTLVTHPLTPHQLSQAPPVRKRKVSKAKLSPLIGEVMPQVDGEAEYSDKL